MPSKYAVVERYPNPDHEDASYDDDDWPDPWLEYEWFSTEDPDEMRDHLLRDGYSDHVGEPEGVLLLQERSSFEDDGDTYRSWREVEVGEAVAVCKAGGSVRDALPTYWSF